MIQVVDEMTVKVGYLKPSPGKTLSNSYFKQMKRDPPHLSQFGRCYIRIVFILVCVV